MLYVLGTDNMPPANRQINDWQINDWQINDWQINDWQINDCFEMCELIQWLTTSEASFR